MKKTEKRSNRKKTWRIAAVAAALLMCMSVVSCGASSSAEGAKSSADGYMYNEYSEVMEAGNAAENEAFYEEYDDAAVEDVSRSGAKSNDKSADRMEDKIIRTANIDMESDDAEKCYQTLMKFAKENGGSEQNVSKSYESYGDYEYLNINATLKIAPDKLEEFITLAEKTDKVTSSEISSDDVTREYYDVKLRLESKKEALKNYYKLLSEAKTIQESLEVQRYITDLTAEIESMEGTLKYYDSRVDLSTVYLNIRQRDKNAEEIEDFHWDSLSFGDFCKLMKNGFLSVLNFLWSLLLWLIIAIVVLSPVLLIAGVMFFLIRRYRKKHPKAPKAPKSSAPAAPTVYYTPTYTAPQQAGSDSPAAQDTKAPEKK